MRCGLAVIRCVRVPAARPELAWIRPYFGQPVGDVRAEDQQSAGADAVPVEPQVAHHPAGGDHAGGVQPQRLVDDAVEVGQRVEVGCARRCVTQHPANFVGGAIPGTRHGQQRVDRPGQRAARGLVPGGDQRDDRVANLVVAQRISLVAAAVDQHGQHVVVGSGRGAGVGDQGVDEVVETLPGGHRPAPAGGVEAPLQRHHLGQLVGQVQQRLELLTEKVGVRRQPRAEQALGGGAPDRRAALPVDVQPLPGPPAVDGRVDVRHHGLHVVLDLPVAQPRRHHAAAPPVVVPVADDQRGGPVDPGEAFERLRPAERVGVGEHELVRLGSEQIRCSRAGRRRS